MLEQVERGFESLKEARIIEKKVYSNDVEFADGGTGHSYHAHFAVAPEPPVDCVAELFRFPERIRESISVRPKMDEEQMLASGKGLIVDYQGRLCMPQLHYEETGWAAESFEICGIKIDHSIESMNCIWITMYPSVAVARAHVEGDNHWICDEYVPIVLINELQPSFEIEHILCDSGLKR